MIIPADHQTIMPYLILQDAARFLNFTTTVFDAVQNLEMTSMREDKTIRHSEVTIGGSTIMFADSTDQFLARPAGMFIYVEDADETFQKAIDAGARIVTPLSDQEYGRTAGITDPTGNTWWITSMRE